MGYQPVTRRSGPRAPQRPSALLLAAALALGTAATARAQDGAAVYQRCAACHQSNGAGVPGVFPPLRAEPRLLAARPDGRRYLVLAVVKGLAGPIVVAGETYRSGMPAQGALDDGAVAAVLNHVTTAWSTAGPAPKPFTADEVKAIRSSGAALSAADVAKLQPKP